MFYRKVEAGCSDKKPMKLYRPHLDARETESRLRDLEVLLAQPSYREMRPCEGCRMPCACSSSEVCPCLCGPGCTHAPVQMSSEGDRYPVEPKVAELVFGFNCLRVCPPFWSCEGHRTPDGTIQRVPQVWFYTRSLVYPRLIGDWLARLYFKKRIANPWHVCVSYSESSLDTGFSIEPDLKLMATVCLEGLHQDVVVLSDALVPDLRTLAHEYLARYRPAG